MLNHSVWQATISQVIYLIDACANWYREVKVIYFAFQTCIRYKDLLFVAHMVSIMEMDLSGCPKLQIRETFHVSRWRSEVFVTEMKHCDSAIWFFSFNIFIFTLVAYNTIKLKKNPRLNSGPSWLSWSVGGLAWSWWLMNTTLLVMLLMLAVLRAVCFVLFMLLTRCASLS